MAVSLTGTPYLWGSKYPAKGGLDCSGLVTWCLSSVNAIPAQALPDATKLKRGAYFRTFWNADRLFRELEPTDVPQAGDVACYGKPTHCSHVMLCTGVGTGVIGASGGDQTTTSPEEAKRRGAAVKPYPSHLYRKDFIGFRKGPF